MLELFSEGEYCATTWETSVFSGSSSNKPKVLALAIWRNMAMGSGSGRL
jgi:hypothetical protein